MPNSQFNLTEPQLKYVKDFGMDKFHTSKTWKKTKGHNAMAKEAYQFYRGIPAERDWDFQHNYWKMMTFRGVESILPRLYQGLFSTDEFVRYLPIGTRNEKVKNVMTAMPESGPSNLNKAVLWKLNFETDFLMQAVLALKNSLVYSCSTVYYPWMYKQKRRFKRFYNPNTKKVERQQDTVVTVDAPFMKNIDYWDSFPEPGHDNIRDMDLPQIREIVSKNELYQRALPDGSPYMMSQIMKLLNKEGGTFPTGATEDKQDLDQLLGLGNTKAENANKVELIHSWGYFGLDKLEGWNPDGGTKNLDRSDVETHFVIANRSVLVAIEFNPYDNQERPLDVIIPIPNTHGLYGLSVPEIGRGVQLKQNDEMNLRADVLEYSVMQGYKVNTGSSLYKSIESGNIVIYPGVTLPVESMEDIGVLESTYPNNNLFTEEAINDQAYNGLVGVLDAAGGKPLGGQKTATGINRISAEFGARQILALKIIQAPFRRMMHNIGKMVQQLLPAKELEKPLRMMEYSMSSKKLNPISIYRGDVQGDFETIMTGSAAKADRPYMGALMANLRAGVKDQPYNFKEFDKQQFENAEMYNVDKILEGAEVAGLPIDQGGQPPPPPELTTGKTTIEPGVPTA